MARPTRWRHRLAAAVAIAGLCTASAYAGPTDRVSFGAGLDVTTAYFFRGMLRERHGLIVQPSAEIDTTLYRAPDYDLGRDGPLSSVALRLGTWNSVHSQSDTGTFHESDLYGGLALGFFERLELAFSYVAYLSPDDSFDTIQELDVALSLDDVEWLGPLALRPQVLLAHELDGRAFGPERGTYLQLGIQPTFALLPDDRYPVSLILPIVAGFSIGDYYETFAHHDETWGFTSVGAVTSVPLAFLGDTYGVWSASLGAHVYTFNDNLETINEDDDPWVVGMAGLSVAY